MARPLRIKYPGAWYLIYNKGRHRRKDVFPEDENYACFIDLIKESVSMWGVKVGAFCILPKSYYILINTPDGNISQCMKYISGVYSQRYNRTHKIKEKLFKDRYRSILVDGNDYLTEIVKYIHRAPLREKLVTNLNSYTWSSHKGYLSDTKKWDWISKDDFLSLLSKVKATRLQKYRTFVSQENSDEILDYFSRKRTKPILGSDEFVEWAIKKTSVSSFMNKVHKAKFSSIKVNTIKDVVAKSYKIEVKSLHGVKKNLYNEPRNVAIYLTRKLRRDTEEKIAGDFKVNNFSTVSSIIKKLKVKMSKSQKLRIHVEKLEKKLIKS